MHPKIETMPTLKPITNEDKATSPRQREGQQHNPDARVNDGQFDSSPRRNEEKRQMSPVANERDASKKPKCVNNRSAFKPINSPPKILDINQSTVMGHGAKSSPKLQNKTVGNMNTNITKKDRSGFNVKQQGTTDVEYGLKSPPELLFKGTQPNVETQHKNAPNVFDTEPSYGESQSSGECTHEHRDSSQDSYMSGNQAQSFKSESEGNFDAKKSCPKPTLALELRQTLAESEDSLNQSAIQSTFNLSVTSVRDQSKQPQQTISGNRYSNKPSSIQTSSKSVITSACSIKHPKDLNRGPSQLPTKQTPPNPNLMDADRNSTKPIPTKQPSKRECEERGKVLPSNVIHLEDTNENKEDEELQTVIELSKKEAIEQAKQQAKEEEELQKALRESAFETEKYNLFAAASINNTGGVIDLSDLDDENNNFAGPVKSIEDLYSNLSREDFENCFNEWFYRQAKGGIEEVERGSIVKDGNGSRDFRKGRSDHGHQERAQYGRLDNDALYWILDSLIGDCGDLPNEVVGPIKAFIDIGMGIGAQVLQAGLVYGFPSRGIEIMQKRYMLANELLEAFKEYFRRDPPDTSKIQMLRGDFARGFPDGVPVNIGMPDMAIRNFLLCDDLSESEQKSLVVFINNAEDVFDARSNDCANCRSLDSFLAELFGNMHVGVRFVTFTSLTKFLERSEWWREDVIQLESGCVSWSKNSQPAYVLTKLRDTWTCVECKLAMERADIKTSPLTNVVDNSGRLQIECLFCGKGPTRTSRRKNAGVKKETEK